MKPEEHEKPEESENGVGMRLNKYVAHCGICSRRKAAEYIKHGLVSVNGEVAEQPYYVVQEGDEITFRGSKIVPERKKVYLLMNKPRKVITSLKDEHGRRTVIDLLAGKVPERVYPVGRLDFMTTGLLILTNDGDLAKKLAHPSFEVKKFYQVTLDKEVSRDHLKQIRAGLTLEDGLAPVDGVDYVRGEDRRVVGIEIHIGRNRIVRRIFESLGYTVERLDRTYYAGLTKKDLSRGWWRHLTPKEVRMLKHFV